MALVQVRPTRAMTPAGGHLKEEEDGEDGRVEVRATMPSLAADRATFVRLKLQRSRSDGRLSGAATKASRTGRRASRGVEQVTTICKSDCNTVGKGGTALSSSQADHAIAGFVCRLPARSSHPIVFSFLLSAFLTPSPSSTL